MQEAVKFTTPLLIPKVDYNDFLKQALGPLVDPDNENDIDLKYEFKN